MAYTKEEVDELLSKELEDHTREEIDRIIEIFLEAVDTDQPTFNRITKWINTLIREARP